MKLETIRQALQEIASGKIPGHKAGMWIEDHARDIDTLLAEVERLRAERRPFSDGLAQKVIDEQVKTIDRLTAKLATEPPTPPLPAEVEEMRKKLDGPHEWGYRCVIEGTFISDPAPFDAASLLSRWPGGQAPEPTNE